MQTFILDIETIASKRLEEYRRQFEPAPPEPEPEEEPEINPKTGKPKRKAKAKSAPRAKSLKSDKPGLSYLTGRIICTGLKPDGKTPIMFADENEKQMLSDLYEYLEERQPLGVVTYNGRAFDVPFITMRGLLYNLDFANVLPQDRYSKSHVDLYEVIGGKWGMSCKLAELAWFLGLEAVEGKGSDVQQMYDEGRLEDIIAHCKSDIITTEKIYHRIMGERKPRKY